MSESAFTASRRELRDRPSRSARSFSLGSRSPGPSSPVTIMALIFSMASSVTGTANPSRQLCATHTLPDDASTLGRPAGQTFHKIALQRQVKDQHGHGGQEHQGEHGAEVGLVLPDRPVDPGSDRGALAGTQDDQ